MGIQQASDVLFGIRPAVGPADSFDFPAGVTVKKARDHYASMNDNYFANYGIHAIVTEISVNAAADTVLVQVSADLDRFFPSLVPNVVVTERGEANIRAFTH